MLNNTSYFPSFRPADRDKVNQQNTQKQIEKVKCLAAEAVQSAALAFEGVHHIHGSDRLPAGVLGVGDGITHDILQENFQDTTGLLVDEARDTLDTTTACETADGGLGDTLDVITQDPAVTLGAALSESRYV